MSRFLSITGLGLAAVALSGCVGGNEIGVGATYENSVEVVTLDLRDGRTLDCLSGPWTRTILYDNGIVKNADGTQVAQGTATDQAADFACREYFLSRSHGVPSEQAGADALETFYSRS